MHFAIVAISSQTIYINLWVVLRTKLVSYFTRNTVVRTLLYLIFFYPLSIACNIKLLEFILVDNISCRLLFLLHNTTLYDIVSNTKVSKSKTNLWTEVYYIVIAGLPDFPSESQKELENKQDKTIC